MKSIMLLFLALILLSCSESEDVTPLIEDLQRDINGIRFTLEALGSRISRTEDITPLIADVQKAIENLEGEVDFLIEDSESKFNSLTSLIESNVKVECDLYGDWMGSWKHIPSIFDDAESGFRFHDNGDCEFIAKTNRGWESILDGRYWVCSESYVLIFFSDDGPTVVFGTWKLEGGALTLLWFDGDLAHEMKKI